MRLSDPQRQRLARQLAIATLAGLPLRQAFYLLMEVVPDYRPSRSVRVGADGTRWFEHAVDAVADAIHRKASVPCDLGTCWRVLVPRPVRNEHGLWRVPGAVEADGRAAWPRPGPLRV